MTTLDDHLRKMDTCSHLLPDPGGETVRSCIRAIRVLAEQRDDAVLRPYLYRDRPFCEYHNEFEAAVLAAMDAKETT